MAAHHPHEADGERETEAMGGGIWEWVDPGGGSGGSNGCVEEGYCVLLTYIFLAFFLHS